MYWNVMMVLTMLVTRMIWKNELMYIIGERAQSIHEQDARSLVFINEIFETKQMR